MTRRELRKDGTNIMKRQLFVLCLVLVGEPTVAQAPQDNSNLWPVHRDTEAGFRISYPPEWIVVQPRGPNVRFSVNPPGGPGNCNVVARPDAALSRMNQSQLNREIESLPDDRDSWAGYVGVLGSQVVLVESRRARILDVPALVGVIETTLETLEGKFMRRAMVALTLKPGVIWTLNCGATSFNPDQARSRFAELQATFSKVFGSFAFLR
jgi:hypothetical protein